MKVKDEYTQNNFFKEVLKSLVTAEAPNSQHTGNMTVTCQPLKKTDSIPPQLQEKCMEAEKNVKSLKNGMQCAVLISQQVTSVALFNLQQLQHLHRSSTNPVPPVTPILAYCRLSLVRRTKPCKQNWTILLWQPWSKKHLSSSKASQKNERNTWGAEGKKRALGIEHDQTRLCRYMKITVKSTMYSQYT